MSKNQSKHTPGKWTISGHHCGAIRIKSGDAVVAYAPADDVPELQSDANARLIAAAPELLAALRDAYSWLCSTQFAGRETEAGQQMLCDMRAAIAKAEAKE